MKSCALTCFLLLILLAAVPAQAAAGVKVILEQSGKDSFRLRSGSYTLTFDPQQREDKKGWIVIRRDGMANGLATKLANGPNLDVTDLHDSLGSTYYGTAPRKDQKLFRSLQCQETSQTIVIHILSQRQWAGFDSQLIAYKAYPGLVHWKVTALARRDRAFSGKGDPDCFFINGQAVSEWGDNPRQIVRYNMQRGPNAPIVYFRDLEMKSYVFYFEDLSSMNPLYRLTGCENPYDYPALGNPGSVKIGKAEGYFQMSSPDGNNIQPLKPYVDKAQAETEFGYVRPQSYRVPKGAKITFTDTYLYLKPAEKIDNITVCRNFVEMLGDVYQFIYKPPTIHTDWAGKIVPRMVKDIMRPENSSVYQGKYKVPRDYVCYDYAGPTLWPIIQLLEPLELYVKKYPGQKVARELRDRLNEDLPIFFDKNWGGFTNNVPPIAQDQYFSVVFFINQALIMTDLARLGNANAKMMITGFRGRLLKMGRAFNYEMADMWLRDFSKQKNYYQTDATCAFMYIMMGLYDLSGGKDKECLEAAKAAAVRMSLRCMDLIWEPSLTATGFVACEQLFKATGDPQYRELAYIPLANLLREAWLWQCGYGVGEHITTFWSFCFCPSGPYTAEYDSHRSRVHLKDYQARTEGYLNANVSAMLKDAWRRGPTQSRFALPPLLVQAGATPFMAAEGKSQTDCGEIRYDQMIPVEDMRAGWGTDQEWFNNNTVQGSVGQQIYGAGGPVWYALWQDELD